MIQLSFTLFLAVTKVLTNQKSRLAKNRDTVKFLRIYKKLKLYEDAEFILSLVDFLINFRVVDHCVLITAVLLC
jgi:hypothetical protein